jgi:hypothetical protein
LTVTGLTNDVQHFIGLGIRHVAVGGEYQQTGPTLSATPGTPLFVDPSAPGGGDGSLGAPYTLLEGVLNAFALLITTPTVPINVWMRGGTYTITSTLPVAAGVNLYGGFGAAFDLATRDVTNTPTIWNVASGQFGLSHSDAGLNSNFPAIVDGVRMNGAGVGRIGIDSNGTDPSDLELRSVVITDMVDRGIRLRNLGLNNFNIVMMNCQSSRNGADGLNGSGIFDYSIYNCIFASNVQEGVDLGNLVPEDAGTARFSVTSSQFFGNGAEGLDCTLGLPLAPTSGSFEVRVRACSFERNAAAGCLIDGDFELGNGYSADVLVRECSARANRGHGFHLDLDGPLDTTQSLTAFMHRVRAVGNVLDGIYITSESRPGILGISTSSIMGNLGAGLRIEGPPASAGNRSVLVSHCLIASNFGGGMISRDVPATAASSIAYLQGNAFNVNTSAIDSVTSSDPAAVAFANAPEEFVRVNSASGASFTLASAPGFSTNFPLELADDGALRNAVSISGTTVTLSEAPDDFGAPGVLAAFAPTATNVDEDYTLLGGSIAIGAGLNGADAGPSGSATAGNPGTADEVAIRLMFPTTTAPDLSQTVGANQSIVVRFSKTLVGGSVNGTTVRARRGANTINLTLSTSGANLTIAPASGNWGAGDFQIELDGIRGRDAGETADTDLASAFVLPISR